ncbi:hypothetical protein V8C86DRAFT_648831 [Haematococcus lacustris]
MPATKAGQDKPDEDGLERFDPDLEGERKVMSLESLKVRNQTMPATMFKAQLLPRAAALTSDNDVGEANLLGKPQPQKMWVGTDFGVSPIRRKPGHVASKAVLQGNTLLGTMLQQNSGRQGPDLGAAPTEMADEGPMSPPTAPVPPASSLYPALRSRPSTPASLPSVFSPSPSSPLSPSTPSHAPLLATKPGISITHAGGVGLGSPKPSITSPVAASPEGGRPDVPGFSSSMAPSAQTLGPSQGREHEAGRPASPSAFSLAPSPPPYPLRCSQAGANQGGSCSSPSSHSQPLTPSFLTPGTSQAPAPSLHHSSHLGSILSADIAALGQGKRVGRTLTSLGRSAALLSLNPNLPNSYCASTPAAVLGPAAGIALSGHPPGSVTAQRLRSYAGSYAGSDAGQSSAGALPALDIRSPSLIGNQAQESIGGARTPTAAADVSTELMFLRLGLEAGHGGEGSATRLSPLLWPDGHGGTPRSGPVGAGDQPGFSAQDASGFTRTSSFRLSDDGDDDTGLEATLLATGLVILAQGAESVTAGEVDADDCDLTAPSVGKGIDERVLDGASTPSQAQAQYRLSPRPSLQPQLQPHGSQYSAGSLTSPLLPVPFHNLPAPPFPASQSSFLPSLRRGATSVVDSVRNEVLARHSLGGSSCVSELSARRGSGAGAGGDMGEAGQRCEGVGSRNVSFSGGAGPCGGQRALRGSSFTGMAQSPGPQRGSSFTCSSPLHRLLAATPAGLNSALSAQKGTPFSNPSMPAHGNPTSAPLSKLSCNSVEAAGWVGGPIPTPPPPQGEGRSVYVRRRASVIMPGEAGHSSRHSSLDLAPEARLGAGAAVGSGMCEPPGGPGWVPQRSVPQSSRLRCNSSVWQQVEGQQVGAGGTTDAGAPGPGPPHPPGMQVSSGLLQPSF